MLRQRIAAISKIVKLGYGASLVDALPGSLQPCCSVASHQCFGGVRHGSRNPSALAFHKGFALRGVCSSSLTADQATRQGENDVGQSSKASNAERRADGLQQRKEPFQAITDRIPERPVGVVEGTSYSLVIIAAFGLLIWFVYQFVSSFILEPLAYQCFNHTLAKLKLDPRITVRLGEDIRAWGRDSSNRAARAQIPHELYKDQNGVEHVRLQFHMGGPGGIALVNADMYKDAQRQWQYNYLVTDIMVQGAQQPQRVVIIAPK